MLKNSINDGIKIKVNNIIYPIDLKATFINGGEINLTYDNFSKTISINNSNKKEVTNYLNQMPFEGFSSSSIYLAKM